MRRTQSEEQDSGGRDDLRTDRLVEGLSKFFYSIMAKLAEKQHHFASATTAHVGSVVFSKTSIRMPAFYFAALWYERTHSRRY